MARPPKEKKSTTEEQTQTQSTNHDIGSGSCSYSSPLVLPIGYTFEPTEEEALLILHQWKQNYCFTHPAVHNVNIYDSNPQQLSESFEKVTEDNEWFFISKRTKLCDGGKNLKRGNSEGYWEARTSAKRINAGQGVIGYKAALNYYVGKQPNGVETEWRMHEYSFKSTPQDKVDYALCKIFQTKREAKKKTKQQKELAIVDPVPQVLVEDVQQCEYQQQSLMMPEAEQQQQQQQLMTLLMRTPEAEEEQQSFMEMMPGLEDEQQSQMMMMMPHEQQQSQMMMMPNEQQQSQMMMMPHDQQYQQVTGSLPPTFPQDPQCQVSGMEVELASQSNDNNNMVHDDQVANLMNQSFEEITDLILSL